MAARAAAKNIALLHWIDPAVPRLIKADTGRLRQVLVNLLTNAIKFTDSGEVEVTVDASIAGTGGPWPERTLTFTVRDTGIGIAPEHHDKLFRPFSQVDDSITRRHGGTGLGLAICKNLVHMMGGGISLASEPGKGSTFVFTIWARTEFAAPTIAPQLSGVPIAVCTPNHGFRDELSRLCERFDGMAVPTGDINRLAKLNWNVALIDLDHDGARAYLERPLPDPVVPAEKAIGLIPVSLTGEVRAGLRKHFRTLVNKPLRHDAFPGLILGTEAPDSPAAEATAGMALRILLVEDNVVNQKLMQRLLDQAGCPWVLAENGREALEELATPLMNFDVVLLDLHMPEVDGLTVLEKVRAGEAGKMAQNLWIIALTADARAEQRERAVSAGANDYLTKPLKPGTLAAALRRCVVERGKRQV
jgi:CheY-like chemotaxis protein